jgi:hypothetical protein
MKTQNEQIKAYLNKGKSITPMDALAKFGCFRLSARIKNLRDEGLKIATNYVTKGNKTFASYSVK